MRTAAARFDELHRAAAEEVTSLRQAQALEQGQADLLVKQSAALKRDNHLLKVRQLLVPTLPGSQCSWSSQDC